MDRTETEYRYAQIALDCFKHYLKVSVGVPYRKGQSHELYSSVSKDPGTLKNMEVLNELVKHNAEMMCPPPKCWTEHNTI